MKRRAPGMKLLLFLLAGAIINVTVAWGCALQHPPGTRSMSKEPLPWPSKIPIEWQFSPTLTGRWSQFGRDRCDWMRLNADFDIEATALMESLGWPLRSLAWYSHYRPGVSGASHGLIDLRGRYQWNRELTLPRSPLWPGFAVNTFLYAAVLWVLFVAPFKVRRWRRIKRGQCASCGYSLRGSTGGDRCSECGATPTKRKAETQKA